MCSQHPQEWWQEGNWASEGNGLRAWLWQPLSGYLIHSPQIKARQVFCSQSTEDKSCMTDGSHHLCRITTKSERHTCSWKHASSSSMQGWLREVIILPSLFNMRKQGVQPVLLYNLSCYTAVKLHQFSMRRTFFHLYLILNRGIIPLKAIYLL